MYYSIAGTPQDLGGCGFSLFRSISFHLSLTNISFSSCFAADSWCAAIFCQLPSHFRAVHPIRQSEVRPVNPLEVLT